MDSLWTTEMMLSSVVISFTTNENEGSKWALRVYDSE
jgi:hypothetical protein